MKKTRVFSNISTRCNEIEAKFEEEASMHLQLLMLFQTKRHWTLCRTSAE